MLVIAPWLRHPNVGGLHLCVALCGLRVESITIATTLRSGEIERINIILNASSRSFSMLLISFLVLICSSSAFRSIYESTRGFIKRGHGELTTPIYELTPSTLIFGSKILCFRSSSNCCRRLIAASLMVSESISTLYMAEPCLQ